MIENAHSLQMNEQNKPGEVINTQSDFINESDESNSYGGEDEE